MSAKTEGIAPNASRLLWAGFMAILAAGVGFAIRGGIFANWGKDFGFTAAQLGAIGGAGFSGFCFGIIIGGVIVDKIGYGKLVALALLGHILSAFVTFAATTPANAYNFLFWGMFIFAYANGTLEAVANPLVAVSEKPHALPEYPACLVAGGHDDRRRRRLPARRQDALRLERPACVLSRADCALRAAVPRAEIPEIRSGGKRRELRADVQGRRHPRRTRRVLSALKGLLTATDATPEQALASAAMAKNIGYGIGGALLITTGIITNFSIGSVLLFVLFITHALVGAVELGTDGWIQNITGNLFTPEQGKYLFFWTSAIMFSLRFCAHFIEKTLKISPVGLLAICAITASVGLTLAAGMNTFSVALVALGVYAVGKTFFWPTMLAVVGDRFPQTGAVAMSIMGGIGMLSAGLIGGPGLGYCKDRFTGEELKKNDAALFAEYKAPQPSKFLNIESTAAFGLDGKKLGDAKDAKDRTPAQKTVVAADQHGDRKTLTTDAYIPATMAVIYLLILLYFKSIGGYKPTSIDMEKITGGINGPMEA
jgi:hypothetical protein